MASDTHHPHTPPAELLRIDAIWLALAPADLRAGMDSLLAQVVRSFAGGAHAHTAYVFANRSATRIKVLLYDGTGLWLCTRRLQQGRFHWPKATELDAPSLCISPEQWRWLVGGAPWQRLAHPQAITVV